MLQSINICVLLLLLLHLIVVDTVEPKKKPISGQNKKSEGRAKSPGTPPRTPARAASNNDRCPDPLGTRVQLPKATFLGVGVVFLQEERFIEEWARHYLAEVGPPRTSNSTPRDAKRFVCPFRAWSISTPWTKRRCWTQKESSFWDPLHR